MTAAGRDQNFKSGTKVLANERPGSDWGNSQVHLTMKADSKS